MTTFAVAMPLPPSANNLYRNVRGQGRVITREYGKWREEAGWAVREAWRAAGKPEFVAPISLALRLGIARNRDVSNCIKPVEDLLVKYLPTLPDDRHNDSISAVRDAGVPIGEVRVTVVDSS